MINPELRCGEQPPNAARSRFLPTGVVAAGILLLRAAPASAAEGEPLPLADAQQFGRDIAGYLLDECQRFGWGRLLAIFAVCELLALTATWLLSKQFAGSKGTVKNLFKWIVYSIAGSIGLLVGFVLCCMIHPIFGFVVLALGAFGVVFEVPKTVYEIGFFRALGLIVCSVIAGNAVSFVAAALMAGETELPGSALRNKSPAEQRQVIAEWRMKRNAERLQQETSASQASMSSSSTPAPEPADLQTAYAQLMAERARLNANDPAAIADFNKRVAAYNALRNAQDGAPTPAPSPTPKPVKPKKSASGRNHR